MLQPRVARGVRQVARFLELSLRREVIPEESDAVGAVRAFERLLQSVGIVEVCLDDFHAEVGELAGLVGVGVAGQGAGGELAILVFQNCAYDSPALGTGGASDGDDLLLRHFVLLMVGRLTASQVARRQRLISVLATKTTWPSLLADGTTGRVLQRCSSAS